MAVLIKNTSVELCALPFPLKGLLKGGQDVILSCTYAMLLGSMAILNARILRVFE